MLGCGNSMLSEDMYNDGYRNIVNIDFSSIVINNMKRKCQRLVDMDWMAMDITNMSFAPCSFDVVVEKATLDALLVEEKDVWNPSEGTRNTMDCVLSQVRSYKSWTAFENLSLYLILYWTGPQKLDPNGNIICHWNRAVNPPRLQILRIDGEWVIDDIIMQGTWSHFLGKKKAQKRCCFNCNIWPNWFTSHQSHYCLYYKGIPEFVRKCSMLTEK